MLEAISLCKAYDGKPVIRDFSLRLEKGGRYCFMGPSGCGKTTALGLLMGLTKPDSGEVRGLNALKLSAVFQENRLIEQLTASGNARLVSHASDEAIEALLLEMGLERESLRQTVNAFSGGMKRRAAVCRALMADYDILFLDEPCQGLDEETKTRVMSIVKRRTQGKTVVLVTHDATEAEDFQIIQMTKP